MSHNITLNGVKFTDMTLLGNIVTQLSNGAAKLDMTATHFRTYAGQPTGCNGKIALPGKHDIGLQKNSDASYSPVFDPYNMTPVFQAEGGYSYIGALQREYGLQQAEYEAAQNGYASERVPGPKNTIILELSENV